MSEKGLLRFVTCGSVDDGKSTLIGRLLWASNSLFPDQLEALARDSRKVGTRGEELDFALLLDGLSAEREQGITIDVAYRYFATARRKFIVADCPGHEQYTRNMITGASTADVALILIDARKGVQVQTRRHCYLVSLIGIRRIVVVVSKMDLVDYQQSVFERIESDLRRLAAPLGFDQIVAIPISGVEGDNIASPSTRTAWYQGPALLPLLETLPIDEMRLQRQPLRMPVQWVNRPDADFRGFAGTLAGGMVRPGQKVLVLPSGREATIARVVSADGDLDEALAQQSVTLTLVQETDVSRGDILCDTQAPAQVADQFESMLVWMHPQPMLRGRTYLLKIGAKTAAATVTALRYKVEINSFEQQAADRLELNEIGLAELHLDRPIAFDPYQDNRDTGGFILIDKISNETVAAGMMRSALRRSSNVQWQNVEVNKASRQILNGHASAVVWLTGLSGAGKSTIANLLEKRLHAHGIRTYLLDGDNVRHGLNRDLGFTVEDRVENIRRIAEVAKLMVDAGLLVITAFISPFRAERLMARELLAPGEFLEVYVRTPLEIAEQRDPKGLYKKARAGELKNFTGIGSPYEEPLHPDLVVDTSSCTAQVAADQLFDALMALGILDLQPRG